MNRNACDQDVDSVGTAGPSVARTEFAQAASSNSLPEAFAKVVKSYPTNLALRCSGRTWTYAELDRVSDDEASRLLAKDVSRGSCVGIHMQRSAEAVIAMLAVLKIGAAYVPFDPLAPSHRLSAQVDRGSIAVMMMAGGQAAPGGFKGKVHAVASRSSQACGGRLAIDIHPLEIACVIHTSGSTNAPKGVCISHQAMIDFIAGADYCGFEPDDVVAHGMSIAFDGCSFEIWGALLSGACLTIVPAQTSISELCDQVERDRISVMLLTAGVFNSIGREAMKRLSRLRVLIAGGDVMSPLSAGQFFAAGGKVLVNGYGPTELTTLSHCHVMTAGAATPESIPIGVPLQGTSAYVLDDRLAAQPIGTEGELHVGGGGVALGYLGDPALTAERFLPDPFAADGSRMYCTGDLVRQSANGMLDYIGRIDTQVKIRGFRVELGEIETCLGSLGDFVGTSVVYVSNDAGATALCAYCMPEQHGAVPDEGILLRELAQRLPDYMIPRKILFVEALPLTLNGKIDRKALETRARSELLHTGMGDVQTLTDDLELSSIAILGHLLGNASIRPDDNFFEAGGDSLSAMRFCAAISEEHAVDLPLAVLFEAKTLRDIAEHIRSLKRTAQQESARRLQQEPA
jgi:amino acid adenylation domain-containing protein